MSAEREVIEAFGTLLERSSMSGRILAERHSQRCIAIAEEIDEESNTATLNGKLKWAQYLDEWAMFWAYRKASVPEARWPG